MAAFSIADQLMSQDSIEKAVEVLRNGGVVTCPTEGVFGLSCLPADAAAVQRLLDIKQREASKGLILIAVLNFGLAYIPSGRGALIFSTAPLLTMLLAQFECRAIC